MRPGPVEYLYSCPGAVDRGEEAMSDSPASRPGRTHLPWAMGLACALAVAAVGLLALTDLAGMVMGSWDTPAPGLGWLKAGAIGQLPGRRSSGSVRGHC